MTNESMADRRRTPRLEVLLKISYESSDDLIADYITDLGRGGLFIQTDMPFQPGDRIGFSLSFPGLLEPIQLVGTVRWRRPPFSGDDSPPTGVGVEFDFKDEKQKKVIQHLVTHFGNHKDAVNQPVERPLRILMVEDNKVVRDMVDYAISRYHDDTGIHAVLTLTTTESAEAALEVVVSHVPDLLIIDHFLPGLTGAECIRQLRGVKTFSSTPILAISVGGDDIRAEMIQAGADLFLRKPLLRKSLIHTIGSLAMVRTSSGSLDRFHTEEAV